MQPVFLRHWNFSSHFVLNLNLLRPLAKKITSATRQSGGVSSLMPIEAGSQHRKTLSCDFSGARLGSVGFRVEPGQVGGGASEILKQPAASRRPWSQAGAIAGERMAAMGRWRYSALRRGATPASRAPSPGAMGLSWAFRERPPVSVPADRSVPLARVTTEIDIQATITVIGRRPNGSGRLTVWCEHTEFDLLGAAPKCHPTSCRRAARAGALYALCRSAPQAKPPASEPRRFLIRRMWESP